MLIVIGVAIYVGIVALALVVHELGHVIAGRCVGARISEVVIGLGPQLRWTTRTGTTWRLGVLPIVGWVRFDEAPYRALGPAQRVAIKMAGPAANMLFGGVVFSLHSGAHAEWETLAAVGGVLAHGMDVLGAVSGDLAGNMVDRAVSVWTRVPPEPLGLFDMPVGETIALRALFWTGAVSVGIGLLNLLPVPPLDGHQIVSAGIEWTLGRETARSLETVLLVVGSVALFTVVVFAP